MMAVGAVETAVLAVFRLLWTHEASMGAAASTAVALRKVGIVRSCPSALGREAPRSRCRGNGRRVPSRSSQAGVPALGGPASVPNQSAGSNACGAEPRCMGVGAGAAATTVRAGREPTREREAAGVAWHPNSRGHGTGMEDFWTGS